MTHRQMLKAFLSGNIFDTESFIYVGRIINVAINNWMDEKGALSIKPIKYSMSARFSRSFVLSEKI